MQDRIVVRATNGIYPIYFISDIHQIVDEISKIIKTKKIIIITDTNIERLYIGEFSDLLRKFFNVLIYTVEAGETSKSLSILPRIYEFLIENEIVREHTILAFGGGVIGDLAGFVAGTYLRGISYIQIPTSLLAMVDSSIGGKTAVNLSPQKGKNMIGLFYQPKAVFIYPNFLQTLPEIEYISGFCEIIKHAIIYDRDFFGLLEDFPSFSLNDLGIEKLSKVIYNSLMIKKDVVEKDTTEQGLRAILNFGHTIGHAIESANEYNVLHGICVGIGMIYEAYLSQKKLNLPKKDLERIKNILKKLNLPIEEVSIPKEKIIRLIRYDKKRKESEIRFSLIKKIGKCVYNISISEGELEEILLFDILSKEF